MDSIARPPYGSVDSYANILRPVRPQFLDMSALAIVKVIADDPKVSSGDRIARILAVIAAVEQIRAANEAEDTGLGYSRADDGDDPQPTERRVPSHFQHGTDDGVDELPPPPAPPRVVHLSLRGGEGGDW